MNFEYVEYFVDEIIRRVDDNEGCCISVFAKYEQARDIIKELLMYDFVILDNIELHEGTFDGYVDEFIIEIWSMDGIVYVGCEPAKRDGKYFNYEGDICYLLGDCSSRIMQTCEYDEMYDVSIEEYDECYCGENCVCGCCDCIDEDDNIYGFTVGNKIDGGYNKFTYYGSNPINKSDIKSILKKFGF